jgi:hypothetical protein
MHVVAESDGETADILTRRRPTGTSAWVAALGIVACLAASPAAAQITRISVATDGTQANGASALGALSANGRLAIYDSAATNLVSGDTNGSRDVFVRDLVANTTTRVSVTTAGAERTGDSVPGGISDDGNVIVFWSDAALVADDTNQCVRDAGVIQNCTDVYVHDRTSGETMRVSVASDGTQGNGDSTSAKISGDGRYVIFASTASNLVTGDTNGAVSDVFLHDRVTHQTTLVSVGLAGDQSPTGALAPDISKNGQTLAFIADHVAFGDAPDPLCGTPPVACSRAFARARLNGTAARLPSMAAGYPVLSTASVQLDAGGRYAFYAGVDIITSRLGSYPVAHATLHDILLGKTYELLAGDLPVALSRDARYYAGAGRPLLITDRVTYLPDLVPGVNVPLTRPLNPRSFDASARWLLFDSEEPTLAAGDTNGAGDVFLFDRDPDGDGLPSSWETRFGLDPNNAADGGADPDGDGQTNLQEFLANTIPNGSHKRYFAEGATNTFFSTRIAILNPNDTAVDVGLQLLGSNGLSSSRFITVLPKSRATIGVVDDGTLPDAVYSSVIESSLPVVADRLMRWDATHYGSHLESSIAAPGTSWFFAEGATGGPYTLYYLLQNPSGVDSEVTVTYLRPSPLPAITKTYTVPAHSRQTIDVRGEHPGLAAGEVSAQISATQPIIAERALYYSTPTQAMAAGHDGAGLTATSLQWFIAEGATGFFDEYVLLANPDPANDAAVTVTYLPEGAANFSEPVVVHKQSRLTLDLKARDPRLASTAVSVIAQSTNGVPIVAERVMWWPHGGWYEASLSAGTTATGTKWAIAEGEQGLGSSTYILIANTGDTDGQVTVTLLYESGNQHPGPKTFEVKAHSRKTVDIGADFAPAITAGFFGAIVESSGVPIVVERALYENANGRLWDAGATSVATNITPP